MYFKNKLILHTYLDKLHLNIFLILIKNDNYFNNFLYVK